MPLSGDFAALARLIERSYAAPRIMTAATRELREEAGEQYRQDFASQRDPWGDAWGPNKSGKTPVLDQTGALSSAVATGSAGTIRIRPPKYWVFLQVGANGMPRRAVLPFGSLSGTKWEAPMLTRVEKVVSKHFGVTSG